MASSSTPQYLRFARTLALVSVVLPMPAVTVLGASACSSSSTTVTGLQTHPPTGAAVDSGPQGVQLAPHDAGDDGSTVAEGGGGGIQVMDSGASDAADDGGGPHRGTPELPESFVALMG